MFHSWDSPRLLVCDTGLYLEQNDISFITVAICGGYISKYPRLMVLFWKQGYHGSLFPGRVLNFEHESLGTRKVLSFYSFCKKGPGKVLNFCRLINECLIVRYYRVGGVSSLCAGIIMFYSFSTKMQKSFNSMEWAFWTVVRDKFLHWSNIFSAYLHCEIFHKSP